MDTVKERILCIRISDKAKEYPDFANLLGLDVWMKEKMTKTGRRKKKYGIGAPDREEN